MKTKSSTQIRFCKVHGDSEFGLRKDGKYRCRLCQKGAVTKRRREVKKQLVEAFGGKCVICGYSKSIRALVFHHVDPTKKEFGLGANGATLKYSKLYEEAQKCKLLCANCHAEVHDALEESS